MPNGAGEKNWPADIRLLHWIAAAIVIFMLALGTTMTRADLDAGAKFDLYQLHKSFGFAALLLTAMRIVARARRKRPPWPPTMAAWEIALARAAHRLLYGLLIAMPFLGWLMVSAAPLPVPTMIFELIPVPHLTGPNPALYEAARLAHRFAAWTLAVLIVLHVAAALKHQFVDRDGALSRMMFGRESKV